MDNPVAGFHRFRVVPGSSGNSVDSYCMFCGEKDGSKYVRRTPCKPTLPSPTGCILKFCDKEGVRCSGGTCKCLCHDSSSQPVI